MNSRQFCQILSGDKFTKLSFKGVYAIDGMKMIKAISYPSSFVINLDPSYKPGITGYLCTLIEMMLVNILINLLVTLLMKLITVYTHMQKDGNTII